MSREINVGPLKNAIQACLEEHKKSEIKVDRARGVLIGSDGTERSIHEVPAIMKEALEERLCFVIQNLDPIIEQAVTMMAMDMIRASLGFNDSWGDRWRIERDTPLDQSLRQRIPSMVQAVLDENDISKLVEKAFAEGKRGIKEHVRDLMGYSMREKIRARTDHLFNELVMKEVEQGFFSNVEDE